MSNSCALIFLTLMFMGSPANAWIDGDGKTLKDTADRKSVGNFGVWLLLIDNEEKFYKEWMIPGTLNVETVKEVKKNSFITAQIIFSGCVADTIGNCHVLVDFYITQPNGKPYADILNQPLWIDRPKPKKGTLQIGEAFIRIRIEAHEPAGTYRIGATIRDINADTVLNLETNFLAYE